MATLIPSSFCRYNLSEEEQRAGSYISETQKQVIQNLICDIAEEKLALKFDASNPQSFIQREAELQGQIGILRYILATSDEVVSAQNQLQGE